MTYIDCRFSCIHFTEIETSYKSNSSQTKAIRHKRGKSYTTKSRVVNYFHLICDIREARFLHHFLNEKHSSKVTAEKRKIATS